MMPLMFPLLLLATAIVSVILHQRTSHDIYGVLAVSSAIVCLIWGLVIAHWVIHVITLVAIMGFRSPVMSKIPVFNK